MKRRFSATFVACLVSGCVTVTEQEANSSFDKQKAAEARVVLGLGYLEVGNLPRARENLELAVKYAPDYHRAQNSLAYYYQQVGEFEAAEETYKKALRESPKNGDVLNNYGVFLCKRGEYQKADEYFNRAIEQPYYYQVSASYENAGACILKGGDKQKAEHYFRRSLDHDPSRFLASIRLSQLEMEKGELDTARVRLLNIHQKFGYRPTSLALLIEIEKKAGNDDLVRRYSETFRQHYPDSQTN